MAQKETKIKMSPVRGLFYIVVAAGMSFLGYKLLFNGEELVFKIFGFALLFSFPICLIGTIVSGFGGEGPCPVCNSPIQTFFGNQSSILCQVCGTYLDEKNKTLREIDPDSLTERPVFAAPTPWTDIASARSTTISLSANEYISEAILIGKEGVRVLDAHWPDGCCVCDKPATHGQTVSNTFVYTPPGVIRIRDKEVTVIAKEVPHCDDHKDGVEFGTAIFGNPPQYSGFGLLFRSYNYRNKFMKLNPWKWI